MTKSSLFNRLHYIGIILLIIHFGSYLLFKTEIFVTYPILYSITILVRLLSAFSFGVIIALPLRFPQLPMFFQLAFTVWWAITALPSLLFILRYTFLIYCPIITTLRTATILSFFCGVLIIPILKSLHNHLS